MLRFTNVSAQAVRYSNVMRFLLETLADAQLSTVLQNYRVVFHFRAHVRSHHLMGNDRDPHNQPDCQSTLAVGVPSIYWIVVSAHQLRLFEVYSCTRSILSSFWTWTAPGQRTMKQNTRHIWNKQQCLGQYIVDRKDRLCELEAVTKCQTFSLSSVVHYCDAPKISTTNYGISMIVIFCIQSFLLFTHSLRMACNADLGSEILFLNCYERFLLFPSSTVDW